MENLLRCHGQRFLARIERIPCEGKISVQDGRVYLCQNKTDGTCCKEKFEYKYSWVVGNGSESGLSSHDVTDFKLISSSDIISDWHFWNEGDKLIDDDKEIHTIIFRHNELFVLADSSNIASVNFTGEELVSLKYKLYVPEEKKEACLHTEDILPANLLECDGKYFSATIRGVDVTGRISVAGRVVYLCQNEKDGVDAHNKYGYKYSWQVRTGDEWGLTYEGVTNFKLLKSKTNDKK